MKMIHLMTRKAATPTLNATAKLIRTTAQPENNEKIIWILLEEHFKLFEVFQFLLTIEHWVRVSLIKLPREMFNVLLEYRCWCYLRWFNKIFWRQYLEFDLYLPGTIPTVSLYLSVSPISPDDNILRPSIGS